MSNRDVDLRRQRLGALGLYLNAPEPTIICCRCRFALKASVNSIVKHVAEKHHVSKSACNELKKLLCPLTLLDPKELSLRSDGSLPHPHLLTQRGAACKHCTYKTTSIGMLGRHLSKSHGMKRKTSGWIRDEINDGISLQSWDQNGACGYWIVKPDGPAPVPGQFDDSMHQTSLPRLSRLEELHSTERQRIANRLSAAATDAGSTDMALTTNWMRRAGWDEMFAGANRKLLVILSQLPYNVNEDLCLGVYGDTKLFSSREDEGRLMHIIAAIDRMFDRCEDTVRHTDISIRCWLRGQYPDRPYKAPFELVGRKATTDKYRRLLKRCVCFLIRFWRLEGDVRQSLLKRSMTESQCQALTEIWSDGIWSSWAGLQGQSSDRNQARSYEGALREGWHSREEHEPDADSEGDDESDDESDDASAITADSDELCLNYTDMEGDESERDGHDSGGGYDYADTLCVDHQLGKTAYLYSHFLGVD